MFDALGPGTTVRAVLGLEIFQRVDAFVAAGEEGLDRPVRWVHAAEISDIAQFLRGGELLLTAGQGLGHTEAEQRAYISSIAEVGVAALVVELSGRMFESFPRAVVEEAAKHSLPLVGLAREVPFVEASAQVLELLTAQRVREISRTVEVHKILTDRLLSGADHVSLVRALSEFLHRPIILESADHELQACYGSGAQLEDFLSDWSRHARSLASHGESAEARGTCLRRPIVVQGSTWGHIHMPWEGTCTHIDQVVLEQGASAIAISFLNERVSGTRSRHQQGILISRLMLGDISGKGFVDRALRLGKDLRKSRLVVVIVGSENDSTDLERQVSVDLRQTRLESVTADIGEAVLSVVALRNDKSLGQLTKALRSETRYLGISKLVPPEELPGAIEQARAASFARQPCQFFDKLGILRLLVPLSHGADLAAYVEDELGPLLEYDAAHDSSLFPTLEAYLRCDGNKTIAARDLFVQRRTLYYRLERVQRIIGMDLEDPDVRLRLQVAIRGSELLRNSRGSASPNHRSSASRR